MTTLRSVDGFERALARGLPPIVWISGDEPLLVIEAADAVRARARLIGFAERQIIDLGARFDFSLLTEATRSMSLFGERRLVDIRLAGKPSKEFGDALREALPTLGDDCRLLVTGDRLERATTSTAWFGALEPALLWYETPRVDRDALPGWLASRLARQRQTGSPLVLALIATAPKATCSPRIRRFSGWHCCCRRANSIPAGSTRSSWIRPATRCSA